MAAPFPYNARSGVVNNPAESEAENLVGQYSWLARWSDEMNNDVDLDYKKLAQFAFHCRQFRRWYDALQLRGAANVGDSIQGSFLRRKMSWADRAQMFSDLTAIYDAAGVFYDWIVANMQAARNYTTAQFDANFETQTDVPVKVAKVQAVANRISQFRNLFT